MTVYCDIEGQTVYPEQTVILGVLTMNMVCYGIFVNGTIRQICMVLGINCLSIRPKTDAKIEEKKDKTVAQKTEENKFAMTEETADVSDDDEGK